MYSTKYCDQICWGGRRLLKCTQIAVSAEGVGALVEGGRVVEEEALSREGGSAYTTRASVQYGWGAAGRGCRSQAALAHAQPPAGGWRDRRPG